MSASGVRSPEKHGEQPEPWMAGIEDDLRVASHDLAQVTAEDLAILIRDWNIEQIIEDQMALVRLLVRQHYLSAVESNALQAFWAVPQAVLAHWKRIGIRGPYTTHRPFDQLLSTLAEAAIIGDELTRQTTYDQLLARIGQLVTGGGLAQERAVAKLVVRETFLQALDALSGRHAGSAIDVVASGRRADFLAMLDRSQQTTRGQRSLAGAGRYMAHALNVEDRGREWERAMVTTANFSYNLCRIDRLVGHGTRHIAWSLHPDACDKCKFLLLWPDGSVRVFSSGDLVSVIRDTGGLNVGRSAAKIGQADGWVVGALIHPWCRCRPRQATRQEIVRDHELQQQQY